MPTINSANLTLTTVGQTVTINVTFNAVFTPFERQLAGLGLIFHPHVDVWGMDPAGSLTGTFLINTDPPLFPHTKFAVTVGTVDQVIAYNVSKPVARSLLQEDTGAGDSDEIRCRIRIHAIGMPLEFTEEVFTDQEILLG